MVAVVVVVEIVVPVDLCGGCVVIVVIVGAPDDIVGADCWQGVVAS